MARGLLPISANFERRIAAPIDDMRVELKSDLLLPASWTADDNVVYTWLGMFALVYGDTLNNGGYLLIASDYTLEASWLQIGSSVDLSDYVTSASLFRNGLIKSELLPDITSDVIELLELASILEDVVGMISGDKAFYTDDNKIYTYSGTAWENPQTPVVNKLYLCKFDNLTYKWNGTTLVATTSPLPYATNGQAIAGTSFSRVLSPYANKYAFTTWIAPYALQSWVTANYVVKDGSKILSDENFTTTLKNKLEGINDHYRGTHPSYAALVVAVPFGNPGDEAIVDAVGIDPKKYIWDDTDEIWVLGTGTSVTVDQSIIEGSTNAVSGGAVFSGLASKEASSNKSTVIEGNETSNTLFPTIKAMGDWVTSLFQKKTDNSLETTSKQIAGAINEVNTKATGSKTTVTYTAAFTLSVADKGKVIIVNSASDMAITIPAGLTAGSFYEIWNKGAGVVSFVAGSGNVINSSDSRLKIRGQYSGAYIYIETTNITQLSGDIVL